MSSQKDSSAQDCDDAVRPSTRIMPRLAIASPDAIASNVRAALSSTSSMHGGIGEPDAGRRERSTQPDTHDDRRVRCPRCGGVEVRWRPLHMPLGHLTYTVLGLRWCRCTGCDHGFLTLGRTDATGTVIASARAREAAAGRPSAPHSRRVEPPRGTAAGRTPRSP